MDQRLDPSFRNRLGKRLWKVVASARTELERADSAIHGKFSSASFTDFTPTEVGKAADVDNAVVRVVQAVLSHQNSGDVHDATLLYVFTAHLVLLPKLSITERARQYRQLHSGLEAYLRSTFLPKVFFALQSAYSNLELDVDGRIFLELLAFILQHPSCHLSDMLGNDVGATVDEIWARCGSPAIDVPLLGTSFPFPYDDAPPDTSSNLDVSVMPFESALFQEAISSVQAVVLPSDQIQEDSQERELHVPFSDTRHWHNVDHSILPKHLGGTDRVALTDWQRERKLRSDQRFMAKMQWQAESLTGALGRQLQRLTIVATKARSEKTSKPSQVWF